MFQVPPGATVQLLHSLVLKHKVGRLARSSASTLQLHFTLDAAERAQQPPRQVDCAWDLPNLVPDLLPHPPALLQVGSIYISHLRFEVSPYNLNLKSLKF